MSNILDSILLQLHTCLVWLNKCLKLVYKIIFFSGNELRDSTLQLVQIYFNTATFDDIERDKKIKTEAQLSLIGGTMGLLTGFSIISGVEIVFFLFRCTPSSTTIFLLTILFRFVSSFTINRDEVKSAVKTKFENHLM